MKIPNPKIFAKLALWGLGIAVVWGFINAFLIHAPLLSAISSAYSSASGMIEEKKRSAEQQRPVPTEIDSAPSH